MIVESEGNKYPEHNKLSKVREQSQWIGTFLEWGHSKGYQLMEWFPDDEDNPNNSYGEWGRVRKDITQLLAEYLDINLVTLEEEKVQMLNEIRELNKTK